MEPVPSDRRGIAQVVAVVLAGALGTALVVGLLWYVFRPAPTATSTRSTIDPAEETSESPVPAVPSQTATDTTGSVVATASPVKPGRVPRIAFRVGDTLYVAGEDGAKPAKVTRAADGPYALSPDGATLAVVDGAQLRLVDVASGASVSAGAAEAAPPEWAPDSSMVYFVRSAGNTLEVWRAGRDGRGARRMAEGAAVSVSPDGRTVVVRRDAGASLGMGAVYVSRNGGAFAPVTVAGQPTSVAVSNNRLFVGIVDESGRAAIVSTGLDGRGAKKAVGEPTSATPAVWGQLDVAPDGERIAAVAVGDDGFSRVSVVRVADGGETRLSRRRDGYARGWSAKGDALFVLEGNYFQGEPTVLVRMAPDGTKRQPVVTGAE